uniref:Uncharacterized protein n=1 Tax=Arundo donax TaxID=35708 RepID=A0A0A9FZ81_ARUDO
MNKICTIPAAIYCISNK